MLGAPRVRLVATSLVVAAAFAVVSVVAPHSPEALRAAVDGAGVAAPLVLLAAWAVLTPALFPGTVLAAGSGLLLGTGGGLLVSLAGATVGATIAFGVARVGGVGGGTLRAGGRLGRVQARLERRPVLAVAALRAAPGMPATLLNYAVGLSRVRTRDFVVGITIGGAPRVVVYTLLGAGLARPGSAGTLLALGGLALVTAASAGVAWRLRRTTVPSAG